MGRARVGQVTKKSRLVVGRLLVFFEKVYYFACTFAIPTTNWSLIIRTTTTTTIRERLSKDVFIV
jgi:hypothetical protein